MTDDDCCAGLLVEYTEPKFVNETQAYNLEATIENLRNYLLRTAGVLLIWLTSIRLEASGSVLGGIFGSDVIKTTVSSHRKYDRFRIEAYSNTFDFFIFEVLSFSMHERSRVRQDRCSLN